MATMETRADVLERSAALTHVSLTLCRRADVADVTRALGADVAPIRRVKRAPWINSGAGQPREGNRKAATIQPHVECFHIWDQERQALTS